MFMCLCSRLNTDFRGTAYRSGLTRFDCGRCPECLSKKQSMWALRCHAQLKESKVACMVTLTYDSFKYDKNGNIIGENLNLRCVDKKDCQKFIKRLREYFDRVKNTQDIKYLLTAEYGKRTGRPHYHAILFGLQFDDLIFHKKSKRGNIIYRSRTLEKLWKHGICTVDSVTVSPAIARYCTKYAVKDTGNDDTFMLVSKNLGINQLLKEFNGRSYWLEGHEFPIPRGVWQKYISEKHASFNKKSNPERYFTTRYVNNVNKIPESFITYAWKEYTPTLLFPHKKLKHLFKNDCLFSYKQRVAEARENSVARNRYRNIRDNDVVYKSYKVYWKAKIKSREKLLGNEFSRVSRLDDKKYHNYKSEMYKWFYENRLRGYNAPAPRCEKTYTKIDYNLYMLYLRRHLPAPSRPIRADDRNRPNSPYIFFGDGSFVVNSTKNLPVFEKKYQQLKII